MLLQILCVNALEPRKHSKLDFKRAKQTFVVVTKRGNHQTSGEPAANHQYFRERPANHQLPLRTISPLISQQIFCLDVTTPV